MDSLAAETLSTVARLGSNHFSVRVVNKSVVLQAGLSVFASSSWFAWTVPCRERALPGCQAAIRIDSPELMEIDSHVMRQPSGSGMVSHVCSE